MKSSCSSIKPVSIIVCVLFSSSGPTVCLAAFLRDFISVSNDDIWTPDTELLNAATKPEIYLLQGGINLYQDGSILYSKPGIYTSSCSLDLEKFPFDKQNCTILTGSWVYNDEYLSLIPHSDINKQIGVLSSFSHSV